VPGSHRPVLYSCIYHKAADQPFLVPAADRQLILAEHFAALVHEGYVYTAPDIDYVAIKRHIIGKISNHHRYHISGTRALRGHLYGNIVACHRYFLDSDPVAAGRRGTEVGEKYDMFAVVDLSMPGNRPAAYPLDNGKGIFIAPFGNDLLVIVINGKDKKK
jgi:hypothetical protein